MLLHFLVRRPCLWLHILDSISIPVVFTFLANQAILDFVFFFLLTRSVCMGYGNELRERESDENISSVDD